MDFEQIEIGKLPLDLLENIARDISDYTVALIALGFKKDDLVEHHIGSGSLIRVGEKHCILTAHHCIDSHAFKDCIRLGLAIKSHPHHFSIIKDHLKIIDVGKPNNNDICPDIGICVLPKTELGWLLANKSFWDIEKYKEVIFDISSDINIGVYAISGCPDVYTINGGSNRGFHKSKGFQNTIGFCGVGKHWEKDEYDYYLCKASYDAFSNSPKSFKGMSGGGLWHIPLKKEDNGSITYKRPYLSGLSFFEYPIVNIERDILCHGPKSIYERVYSIL